MMPLERHLWNDDDVILTNVNLDNIFFNAYPYERRNAAAALQQFTFMVAQRLNVCKAVLVSR